MDFEYCPICKLKIQSRFMENHHYIPKCDGGSNNDTIRLCGTCHDVLHKYIPIDEVKNYKTIDTLLENPFIAVYSEWISKKNHTGHWNISQTLKKMSE